MLTTVDTVITKIICLSLNKAWEVTNYPAVGGVCSSVSECNFCLVLFWVEEVGVFWFTGDF